LKHVVGVRGFLFSVWENPSGDWIALALAVFGQDRSQFRDDWDGILTFFKRPSTRDLRRLGYSDTWIYNLLSRGILVGERLGGEWRINPDSIAAYELRPRRWRKRKDGGQ